MPAQRVADAYSRRAAEYVAAVGLIEHVEQRDLDEVLSWARSVDGPVLDVGCGPGQWTERLRQEGVDIEGIDPSGAFIDEARARYPLARFRAGVAESLDALRTACRGATRRAGDEWSGFRRCTPTPPAAADQPGSSTRRSRSASRAASTGGCWARCAPRASTQVSTALSIAKTIWRCRSRGMSSRT